MTMPLLDQGVTTQIEQRRADSIAVDWRLVDKREDRMLRTLEAYEEMLITKRLLQLSQGNLARHRDHVQHMFSRRAWPISTIYPSHQIDLEPFDDL